MSAGILYRLDVSREALLVSRDICIASNIEALSSLIPLDFYSAEKSSLLGELTSRGKCIKKPEDAKVT